MNFIKSIVSFALVSSLFLSCKDTASNTTSSTLKETSTDSKKSNAVALKPETASFKIEGMTCAMGCAKTIETKISKMDGVQKASVDFDTKVATVYYDSSILTSLKLVDVIQSTGDGETYKVSEVKQQ